MDASDVRLMQQLLASRHGSLSLPELAARNSESEDGLEEHLDDLMERGLVETLEGPGTYYAVSEDGIEVLKRIGHYEQIGILYDMYEAVETDVEEMSGEDRPRPEWL